MGRYAVVLKTHYWDEFCQRQLERIKAACPSGDVFVMVDETLRQGAVVGHERVIRIKEHDLERLNLPMITTHGSAIWYNIDYPHYVFFEGHPQYDYYVFLEYDVIADVDFDKVIARAEAEQIDYIGFPLRTKPQDWSWHAFHSPLYGEDYLISLSCLSVFSSRALAHLLQRRQTMGREFAAKTLPYWPNNEAFIPTEIARAGLKSESLSAFGNVDAYNWWPPTDEAALEAADAPRFVHPVLAGARYIRSRISHEPNLLEMLRLNSPLRVQSLGRYPDSVVRPILRQAVKERAVEKVKREMARIGLRRPWYDGVSASGRHKAQSEQKHNA